MLLVVLAACLDCLGLIPLHPGQAWLLLIANLVPAISAALAYVAITTWARHHPEAVVFVVLASLDIALLTLRMGGNELDLVAIGYLLLLPVVVAAVMPWETKAHLGWLAFHASVALAFAAMAPDGLFGGGGRPDIVALFAIAITVSVFEHLNRLQAQVLGFLQLEQIRAFNRRARRDQDRLDRLNRILERTTRTDDLTGLRNRLSLKLDLGVLRSRMARRGELLVLLMIDLDRFKEVNDSVGHVAGDEVLRKTAAAIVAAVREEDWVYRYGGEEFLVLLESTDSVSGAVAGERVRRGVEDLGLPHPWNPPYGGVTVSVGVATIGPGDLAEDDDVWIARADAALYQAKDRGRNRCYCEPAVPARLRVISPLGKAAVTAAGGGPPRAEVRGDRVARAGIGTRRRAPAGLGLTVETGATARQAAQPHRPTGRQS